MDLNAFFNNLIGKKPEVPQLHAVYGIQKPDEGIDIFKDDVNLVYGIQNDDKDTKEEKLKNTDEANLVYGIQKPTEKEVEEKLGVYENVGLAYGIQTPDVPTEEAESKSPIKISFGGVLDLIKNLFK